MENISEKESFFEELSKEIKEKYINLFLEKLGEKSFDIKIFNQENIIKEK